MKLTWTCLGIFAVGTVAGIVGKGVYNKHKAKIALRKSANNVQQTSENQSEFCACN